MQHSRSPLCLDLDADFGGTVIVCCAIVVERIVRRRSRERFASGFLLSEYSEAQYCDTSVARLMKIEKPSCKKIQTSRATRAHRTVSATAYRSPVDPRCVLQEPTHHQRVQRALGANRGDFRSIHLCMRTHIGTRSVVGPIK
jgi:hypothetical protein